ncbi:MAG: DUF485 domain-containing protein [Pseudomonadales bacterium]
MTNDQKLKAIAVRTRRRFLFSIIALAFYFSFALAWTDAGAFLSEPIGYGLMNGALLQFIFLIVLFISLELVFLRIAKREQAKEDALATEHHS